MYDDIFFHSQIVRQMPHLKITLLFGAFATDYKNENSALSRDPPGEMESTVPNTQDSSDSR